MKNLLNFVGEPLRGLPVKALGFIELLQFIGFIGFQCYFWKRFEELIFDIILCFQVSFDFKK